MSHAGTETDAIAVLVVGEGVVAHLAIDLSQGRERSRTPPVNVDGSGMRLDEEVIDAIAELRRKWEASGLAILNWRRLRGLARSRSCLRLVTRLLQTGYALFHTFLDGDLERLDSFHDCSLNSWRDVVAVLLLQLGLHGG